MLTRRILERIAKHIVVGNLGRDREEKPVWARHHGEVSSRGLGFCYCLSGREWAWAWAC